MSERAFGPKKPRLHRNVWAASGTSFLTDVSSEMLLNVLPLFLANVLGVRVWAVGVVEGLADTTAALVKLGSGWLSDRLRARKWLAVGGYGVSALAKPFYYVASTWWAVAAIRWGDRVGKGLRTGPRDALLADSTPSARRGLVFGLHRAADTGGAVVGLLVTLWVVTSVQGDAALLEEDTFRRLVLWSLLPAFAGVALLALVARDVRPAEERRRAAARRSGVTDARDAESPGGDVAGAAAPGRGREPAPTPIRSLGRGFGAFLACSALFELGNSADAFLVLRAQERGLSVIDVLWVLLAFNVVYALVATPAGSLSDRVSRKGIVVASWGVYAVTYLGFAIARTPMHVTVLYLLYGVYSGMVAGAAKALVSDLVPAELRGTAYGSYAAAIGLVSLPASVLGGVLWEGLGAWSGFGPAAPFAFGAAMAGVAALLLLWAVPDGRRAPADAYTGRATESRGLEDASTTRATTESPGADASAIPVLAAVIENQGRYLLGRRPEHKRHGGLWEFPGGKLHEGESLLEAARRELAEELSLDVERIGARLLTERDEGSRFEIHFTEVVTVGDPSALEHSEIGWFRISELGTIRLAPADERFARWLAERRG